MLKISTSEFCEYQILLLHVCICPKVYCWCCIGQLSIYSTLSVLLSLLVGLTVLRLPTTSLPRTGSWSWKEQLSWRSKSPTPMPGSGARRMNKLLIIKLLKIGNWPLVLLPSFLLEISWKRLKHLYLNF